MCNRVLKTYVFFRYDLELHKHQCIIRLHIIKSPSNCKFIISVERITLIRSQKCLICNNKRSNFFFFWQFRSSSDATAYNAPKERTLAHTMQRIHRSSLRAAPSKRIKDGCIAFTEMKVLPYPRASPYEPSQLGFWSGGVRNKKGDAGTTRDILPRHLNWNSSWSCLEDTRQIVSELRFHAGVHQCVSNSTSGTKLNVSGRYFASVIHNVDGECYNDYQFIIQILLRFFMHIYNMTPCRNFITKFYETSLLQLKV